MQILTFPQRTQDWWNARRGVPTASRFDAVLTPKTAKPSASQEGYICELIAEKFATEWPPSETPILSHAMAYGIEHEPRARAWYGFETGNDVREVGFVFADAGRYGCSPDGLIGSTGLLELKCPQPQTHIRYLLDGGLPSEYKCQVHGQLIVTGFDWCDFVSFCDGFPALKVRVFPDDFTELLRAELERFCDKLDAAVEKINAII